MRIFVGLSGGVDSAVSAALLKEQGHSVTGVFIKIYRPEFIECTWKEDRLDAMRVCTALAIPFREIDLSDEYKERVVDAMIADYSQGITPNPDILCNRSIKFGSFLTWARAQGADKIATGHYVQVRSGTGKGYELLRGKDTDKDQSYFLCRLKQNDLAHTFFPVGHMLKSAVRKKAREFGLPVAAKHDSQGICFIGSVPVADFLRRYIDIASGPVTDTEGNVIGEHPGAALLTIGQRHGFTLDEAHAGTPHYVVSIHAAKNSVVTSPSKADAAVGTISLRDVSWVGEAPSDGEELMAQARYREVPVRASIQRADEIRVMFAQPHIAPRGQSLVLYREDVCLGGGVID